MTLAAIYIRQTEAGPTPAQQRAECNLAIAANGWTQAREFVDTESFTGRPGQAYGELLAAMRAKKIECVVSYSAERMFRGVRGMVQVFEHARAGGVTFFFCRENLSTEGVHGVHLVYAARLVAEIDLRRRSEITSLSNVHRRMAGLPVGRRRNVDPVLDRIVSDMLDEGIPVNAVARKLGVSRWAVRERAKARATQPQGE